MSRVSLWHYSLIYSLSIFLYQVYYSDAHISLFSTTSQEIVEPVAREKPYMIIPGNWDVKNSIAIQAFVNRYPLLRVGGWVGGWVRGSVRIIELINAHIYHAACCSTPPTRSSATVLLLQLQLLGLSYRHAVVV